MSKILERSDSFQKIDWAQVKNSQSQYKVCLRQSKRIAYLSKKRGLCCETDFISFISHNLILKYPRLQFQSNADILELLQSLLLSSDIFSQTESLSSINSMILASSAYLSLVLKTNIPQILIGLLSPSSALPILELCSSVLSNFFSEDLSSCLITPDLINTLLRIVQVNSLKVKENALFALSNICADSESMRKTLLELDFIPALYTTKEFNIGRALAWSLSNITKESETICEKHLEQVIEILKELITSKENEVITESLWALVNLSAVDHIVQQLMDANLVFHVINQLYTEITCIRMPALKVLSNVCASSHEHTQYVLNFKIFDIMNQNCFIQSILAADVFWILCNVSAGTPNQVRLLERHPIFEVLVVSVIHYDMNARLKAAESVLILLKNYRSIVIHQLCQFDISSILCVGLKDKDANYLRLVLGICEEIIKEPLISQKAEESGLIYCLESILKHNNGEIFETALRMLKKNKDLFN